MRLSTIRESEGQVKGYAATKEWYVMVEDNEIDDIAIMSIRTIDIYPCVPKANIDDSYRDTPHYLAPDNRSGRRPSPHPPFGR